MDFQLFYYVAIKRSMWYERHEALREISFFIKQTVNSLTVFIQKHMPLEMLRWTNQIQVFWL